MWPLDSIRSRRRQKRYDCAFALFLADFSFAQLRQPDRARVLSRVSQLLGGEGVFMAEHRRWAPWHLRMAFIAEAMVRLGMPPAAPGVAWPNFVGSGPATRAGSWILDFRDNCEATDAARNALERVGAYLSRNPLDEQFVEPNLIPGARMTVREYYLRRAAKPRFSSSVEQPHDK